jgi:multidrug efflux pump subunit AcrB
LGIFVLSVVGLGMVPKTFLPDQDFSLSTLTIEMPPGVLLSQTADVAAKAYDIVSRHPEVQNVVESIGEDENGEVRSGNLYIQLVPRSARKLDQTQWQKHVIDELRVIPDARISFQAQTDGDGRDLTLYVVGSNPELVDSTARTAVEQMRTLPELRDPRINGDMARPELVVRPRLDEAAQLGVTVTAISETVRLATLGDLPQNGAHFSLPDRQIPIRVSLVESARSNLATIENLPIRTVSGTTVPLKAVSDISFGEGPARVRRYNQQRRVSLDADLNGAQLGTALEKVRALPIYKSLPPGVQIVEIGSAQYMKELFNSFVLAIVAGVMMVFAVLVLLFARLFQPITILSALPLSIGGAVLALFITGSPFSLPAVLGMLMLMGIVAKNSILLVDFAIEEMRAGKDRTTALIEAGHKRARPIVMTSAAMIAGMLPATFGDSFQAQMAIAVIGGLITSTGLTLVIVPAAFTWIDDLERWLGRIIARRVVSSEAEQEAEQEAEKGAKLAPVATETQHA